MRPYLMSIDCQRASISLGRRTVDAAGLTFMAKQKERFFSPFELGLGLIVLFAVLNAAGFWSYTIDDSYISLQYAGRWVDGLGLTYIDGERVEGFSNPTWVLLLAMTLLLGFETLVGAKLLGLLGHAGIIICTAGILRSVVKPENNTERSIILLGVAFLAVSLPMNFWPATGMETTFYLFMLVAMFWRMLIECEQPESRPYSAMIAAMTTLFRPEAPALVLGGFLMMCAKLWLHKKRLAFWLLLFFTPTIGYLIFRLSYYGYLLPNTAYQKGVVGSFRSLYHYILPWYQLEWVFASLGIVGFFVFLVGKIRVVWPLGIAFLAQLFFLGSITYDWMPNQRFVFPIIPFLAMGVSYLFVVFHRRLSVRSPKFAVFFLLGLLLYQGGRSLQYNRVEHARGFWTDAVLRFSKRQKHQYFPASLFVPWKMHDRSGAWVIEHIAPKSTLAYTEIGILGWSVDVRILDLEGLTSAEMSGATGMDWPAKAQFLGEQRPDWIVVKVGNKDRFQSLTDQEWLSEYEMIQFYRPEAFVARRKDATPPSEEQIWTGFLHAIDKEPNSLRYWLKFAEWSAYLQKEDALKRACARIQKWYSIPRHHSNCLSMIEVRPSRPDTSLKSMGGQMVAKVNATKGRVAYDQKNWKKAIESYSLAIEAEPKKASQYRFRARAYYHEQEYEKSLAEFSQVRRLEPPDKVPPIEIPTDEKLVDMDLR
ncbi:MAG: hypothetical protein VX278_05805, partial [Myxococcota bacterium]|nr:hypothetical protein [Myxococcota bacterium]